MTRRPKCSTARAPKAQKMSDDATFILGFG
jgi:hypothetical protein